MEIRRWEKPTTVSIGIPRRKQHEHGLSGVVADILEVVLAPMVLLPSSA